MDTRFPLTKHGGILLFILVDFSLVLQLCKLGSSLLVHFFLKVCSLNSILLVHLFQNIHLMVLSVCSFLGCSSFELSILLSDSSFNLMLFVIFKPFHFFYSCLLKKDIFFSGLIDILEEINSSLFFSLSLSFSHFVLSLGFLLNKFINKLFISLFIICGLFIVLLKLNNFLSSLGSLSFFNILESFFSG